MIITGTDASGNPTFGPRPAPPPTPLQNQYNLYNSGVAQDATDRSAIMRGYQNLASQAPSYMNSTQGNYTPAQSQYSQSSDLRDATSNLRGLSQNGGYSDQNLQDIRARSVSPIRSIYSNALREVDRNKRLQGGFSPNYNATRARMARDLSTQISDASQNVEGDIAGRQAAGRLAAGPQYAQLTAGQSDLQNQMGQHNADTQNEASRFNANNTLQGNNYNLDVFRSMLSPLQGQASLYGTTPALSNLFGSQAQNAAQLANTQEQQTQQNGLNLVGSLMRGRLG